MHCSESKLTWIKVVLRKGVEPYSVKVVCDMIAFSGHRRVILKSDGESSITALKDAVKASCDVSMGVEVSPMGDSQANGDVERAIQTVQGQVRTMKSALDSNPWLVSYASSVVTSSPSTRPVKLHAKDAEEESSTGSYLNLASA